MVCREQQTVKHYLDILEALYVIFRVYPHHRSVAWAIKRQPKIYFLITLWPGEKGNGWRTWRPWRSTDSSRFLKTGTALRAACVTCAITKGLEARHCTPGPF